MSYLKFSILLIFILINQFSAQNVCLKYDSLEYHKLTEEIMTCKTKVSIRDTFVFINKSLSLVSQYESTFVLENLFLCYEKRYSKLNPFIINNPGATNQNSLR